MSSPSVPRAARASAVLAGIVAVLAVLVYPGVGVTVIHGPRIGP